MSDHNNPEQPSANLQSLELVFLTVIGILVVLALFAASTYSMVSARTPLVIMVPLLALIGLQWLRLYKGGALKTLRPQSAEVLAGRYPVFMKLLTLAAAFVFVVIMIAIFGHVIGLAVFIMLLMFVMARQRFWLSLAITVGSVAFIYVVFEYGFNIELYRGLLFRYLAGYKVF